MLLLGIIIDIKAQVNKVYSIDYTISANIPADAFICSSLPSSLHAQGLIGQTHYFDKSSPNTNPPDFITSINDIFYQTEIPTTISYESNVSNGDASMLYLGSNDGAYTTNLCGVVAGTSWHVNINELTFKPINIGNNVLCGTENVTLNIPTYPDGVYTLQATNDPSNSASWQSISLLTTNTVTFNQDLLPATIIKGVPTYFRIKGAYQSFQIESDVSNSITFYPSFPTPQTKNPIAPLCANGNGSISLSDFKYDDGTVYNGGENLSLVIQKIGDIPGAPIIFTSSSLVVPGLAPGNYKGQINSGSANCTSEFTFTIPNAPPPITASIAGQNPDCSTGTGIITATGGGGTPPYQYSINGGTTYQASNVFTGLTAGSYTVKIIDANGCSPATSNAVVISVPTAVNTVLNNKTNPTGFGLSNGQIILSANGGTGTGYTYAINGGSYTASDTFSGLVAGTYSLTARDNKGCESLPLSVTLAEPTQLGLAISTKTNNICFGGSIGSVEVTASGGTSPYDYSINGGSYQTSNSFNNLTAGNYTLSVKDNNGNIANVNANILQPSSISASITGQNPNCAIGGGIITATANGGTPPYSYALNGGTYVSSNVFTNLAAGTYTVSVTDSKNCSAAISNSVVITLPNPVNVSLSFKNDPTGFNTNDGQIAVIGSGGNGAGFTYSIDGANYVSSGTFTGLPAGTYSLLAKDGNGCASTVLSVTLNQPNQFSINVNSKVDNTCFGGNTGSVTVSASSGTAPYQYEINGGGYQSSNNFTGLIAGNYTLNAKDANDYEVSTVVTIIQPQAITASIVGQNPNCNSGTGTITATAGGGVAPYQYSLNGGIYQSSNLFSGLNNGNYTVTVIDANNCVLKTNNTVNIAIPNAVVSVLGFQNNPTVVGASDGQIVVSATGGSNSGYVFSINGSAYNPSGTFSGLPNGTYLITAKDGNGCVSNQLSITLNSSTQLTLNVTSKIDNSCYGDLSGSVAVLANGGTSPYQYRFNGGVYQSSGSFTGLVAGNYTITVKDATNTTIDVAVNIAQPAQISANIVKVDASCFGGTGSIIINNPTGGSGSGYTYSSNGGTSYQISNIFNLPQGNYLVKIKDGSGCVSVNNNIVVGQPASAVQATVVTQDVKCNGFSSGVVIISASGGSGGYIYSKDNWASSNATGVFTGLLAGQYEFKIKDQADCATSLSVLVKQPPQLVLNIDGKTDATCFGGTGTINVSATGGEGNIAYSSNPSLPFSNGVFSGAVAGTYEIKIIDDNGCIKFANVTIGQPNQLIASAAVTAVTCHSSADGKVVLSVSGGTGTYVYGIKSSGLYASTNTFSGLTAGHYVFSIKDQNGCMVDVNADVLQPDDILLNVSNKQNVLCNGANNGSFVVNATGGNGSYTYKLNGVDQGLINSFNNLASGNYVVRVTDGNGCYKELTEAITEPMTLNLALINKADIKCFGSNTGEISVSASGGVAPFQYALNGGSFQANSTFTSLLSGNYVVQVKDVNLCLQTLNITLTESQKLVASITKQDVKCFGDASGSITINVLGGEAPYQYSVNGSSFQLSNTFSNLIAGNYNLVVRDKNNCQISDQVSVINIAPKLVLQVSAVSPTTCNGVGSISVSSVNGGVQPYLYSIDGNNYSSNQNFTGLVAGQYTVFVKDNNGCITSETKTISVPAGISAQLLTTDVSCFSGNNGNIVVNNTVGGNGNYSYSLNGGSFQVSNNFSGLVAGNYSLVVKDNPNSCQYTLNISITEPSKLNLELKSQKNISCNGQNNGKIEVLANGGTSSYQYSIDGGITYTTSGIFSSLIAKNYNVWVKDAHNCTENINVLLTEPALLALSLSSKSDVTCFGTKNGSLVVNPLGGTQPYQYSINGGTQQSSNHFENLAGGNYLINLIDANGCSTNLNVVINENSILGLSINSFKNLSCNASSTGEISVVSTGGSGIYQYSINNGAYQASAIFKNLSAGNYNISVKDDKGCTASITKTIIEPLALMVTKTVTQQKCFDVCDGEIKLSVSGGTAPYTYKWSSGNYGNVSTISNLCGDFYRATIVDANGCSVEDATDIITPSEIKITNVPDTVLCVGQIVTYDAGNPGFSYLWTADNGFSKTTQKVQISEDGKYSLKVTNAIGCSVAKTFTVQTSTTLLKANFLVSTYANVGDTIIVVDVSKPTPSKTSWIFDTGTIMVGGNASSSIKQISFNAPGVYNMMMMVNLGQCADAVQKSITILPKDKKKEVNDALGYKDELFTSFKIYPNPTNGEFKTVIKLSQKMDIKISMYGFGGNLVIAPQTYSNNDNFEINFNERGIPPGIYVLTLEAGNQVETLKIIKI